MIREMIRVAIAVALVVAVSSAAGCNANDAARDQFHSPAKGLVTNFRTAANGEVDRLTLEAEDGKTYEFFVELDPAAPVSAEHLLIHRDQRLPVSVAFVVGADGRRVAHRIDDASP